VVGGEHGVAVDAEGAAEDAAARQCGARAEATPADVVGDGMGDLQEDRAIRRGSRSRVSSQERIPLV
jgi:hypothetical protein